MEAYIPSVAFRGRGHGQRARVRGPSLLLRGAACTLCARVPWGGAGMRGRPLVRVFLASFFLVVVDSAVDSAAGAGEA